MAATQVTPSRDAGRAGAISWAITIAGGGYIAWMGAVVSRSTAALSSVFAGMNVQVPAVTGFLVHNYQWLDPLLFGGTVVFLVAKQFFIRDRWASLVFTFSTVLLMDFTANLMTQALYRPLLDIIEKLNR